MQSVHLEHYYKSPKSPRSVGSKEPPVAKPSLQRDSHVGLCRSCSAQDARPIATLPVLPSPGPVSRGRAAFTCRNGASSSFAQRHCMS